MNHCLVLNPKERLTPKEALDHEWFNEEIPYNKVEDSFDIPDVGLIFKKAVSFKIKSKFELFVYKKCVQFKTSKQNN